MPTLTKEMTMSRLDEVQSKIETRAYALLAEARKLGKTVEEHAAEKLNEERTFRIKLVLGIAIGAFIAGAIFGRLL
jgi:hypothetical protein